MNNKKTINTICWLIIVAFYLLVISFVALWIPDKVPDSGYYYCKDVNALLNFNEQNPSVINTGTAYIYMPDGSIQKYRCGVDHWEFFYISLITEVSPDEYYYLIGDYNYRWNHLAVKSLLDKTKYKFIKITKEQASEIKYVQGKFDGRTDDLVNWANYVDSIPSVY